LVASVEQKSEIFYKNNLFSEFLKYFRGKPGRDTQVGQYCPKTWRNLGMIPNDVIFIQFCDILNLQKKIPIWEKKSQQTSIRSFDYINESEQIKKKKINECKSQSFILDYIYLKPFQFHAHDT